MFYVETWENNKNSRLIDLYKTMENFDTEIVYRVVLKGVDSYEKVYSSLEKPIEYLKNKSSNGETNIIKLSDNPRIFNSKDAFSGEILKTYEKFLKSVSSSPCFKGNVIIYSNNEIYGNILFNTVCGEVIEKGNWESTVWKSGEFHILDNYEELSNIMPKTLRYWPTYYTLDEIKEFFRFPMLYEGECIGIKKETDPINCEGELYLGKNTQNISIPLDLLKNMHLFVEYQDQEKLIQCCIYVTTYGKNIVCPFWCWNLQKKSIEH